MVDSIARTGLVALLIAVAALAASPSTSRAQWAPTCGTQGPFNFDTYEAENFVADYGRAIGLAVEGRAVPAPYTIAAGETINVAYQGIESGPRNSRQVASTNRRIPPSIYKSIAWIEANWQNAANTVPWGGAGPVLRSFDCGYGLGQVTTGMANSTGNASARQAVIGTHFLYNIAEGVRILADKWNSAPAYRPIAGKGDPAILEDWYYAIWSYNGFAFSNHPLNPNRDPARGEVYNCYDPSAPGYGSFFYGDYTYPERVYGCMRYPPKRNGERMYPATIFAMPNFKDPAVANAFRPEAFQSCAPDFTGGCPAMDYPTPVKSSDPTPPASASPSFLADPRFSYSGPTQLGITVSGDGSASSGTVVVSNTGTYIAPFRIRTSQPWLIVQHPGESGRRLQGSVAVGNNVSVVTSSSGGRQWGYDSTLVITVDPAALPSSYNEGTVWLEPLLGSGPVFQVSVTAVRGGSRLPIRAVVPGVNRNE